MKLHRSEWAALILTAFLVTAAAALLHGRRSEPAACAPLAKEPEPVPADPEPVAASPAPAEAETEAEAETAPVNINTADAETLSTLPGVGLRLAERIVADRDENGRFLCAEDLMRVSGIGAKKYEGLEACITAEEEP